MKTTLLSLFCFFSFVCFVCDASFSQTKAERILPYMNDSIPNSIGSDCGRAGSPTDAFAIMREAVKTKDYDLMKLSLQSSNPSFQFMGSILCGLLAENDLISLSEKESSLLQAHRLSKATFYYCSTCTVHKNIALRDLLDAKAVKGERKYGISKPDFLHLLMDDTLLEDLLPPQE